MVLEFVNIYYEHNNPSLDKGPSNLKCALYADVHSAAEKTNFGGQQLAPPSPALTYIEKSSGFALEKDLCETEADTPEGYTLAFGPVSSATEAPGVSLIHRGREDCR